MIIRVPVSDSAECVSIGREGPTETIGVNLVEYEGRIIQIQPESPTSMAPTNGYVEMTVEAMDELAVLYLFERGVISDDQVSSFLEELSQEGL